MLLLEAGEGLVDLVERSDLVERQTHDTRLLGQCLKNGLTNPPHSVRNKFESAGFIEFFGGFYQSQITFIDKVGQAEPLILVLFGNRDDKTQIGPCELFQSDTVAFFDALGEFYLFFYRNQVLATYFL